MRFCGRLPQINKLAVIIVRILQEFPDWRDQYIVDVQTAKDKLACNNFTVNKKKLAADIYSLPANHHQTFFVRLVYEEPIYRMFFAKAIQRSVWFSDPLYGYTFAEAEQFRNDPKRRGQILCGAKIVQNSAAERLLGMVGRISPSQPVSAVRPEKDCDFTGIRVYDKGNVLSEFIYTDAALLRLSEDCDAAETVEYLNHLHFKIENIIGKGYDNPVSADSSSNGI